MEKLDRLGWAAGLSFVSYGARVGIRVNDPAALERMAAYLPPSWTLSASPVVDELCSLFLGGTTRSSSVRRYHLLYWGAARSARTMEEDAVFQALESLLHFVVATRAPRLLFVRAGVVGWRGQAVMICGPPGSGKTTVVEALVRAGATYYSDQYAVLDRRGRVHAYPSALTFWAGNGELPRSCRVEALGGQSGTKPLPVGLVAVTQYRPGMRWRPRVLSSGQAVLALLANTVQARLRPRVVLATFRRVAAHATVLRGKRGEAEETVLPLLNHLYSGNHDGRLVRTSKA